MSLAIYDAAVLVAADRNDRLVWADHRARLEMGMVPLVPATVVAQVSRTPRQAQLRRFLRGCEVASLDEQGAHEAGRLLGRAGTADIVDASLVVLAIARSGHVLTSDTADIERVVRAAGVRVVVIAL